MSQYLDVLVVEGFDTWETVLDITESDLNSLNVKLGHRRKLQRAIAESRGQSADRPLPLSLGKGTSIDGSYRSDDSATEGKGRNADPSAAQSTTGTSTKRKYRRHPKPDEHAPERPPSAYVIFSNHVRETLKGQELSFTEIAKVVGERWQVLPADRREECERQANTAKEKYYAELAEYKKTSEFEAYQKYLEDFKIKHAAPQKGTIPGINRNKPRNSWVTGVVEGKRSKLETDTSVSTRSSSHEQGDRSFSNRRISSAHSDPFAISSHISESSPPVGPARLPSAPSFPSESTSPATHPLSRLNSPRMGDQYSPLSASPRSATLHKEGSYEFQPSSLGRDSRSDPSLPHLSPGYGFPAQPASSTPPSALISSHYQTAPIDLPSRRPFREPARLPPLTHEDTTISSDGGYSNPPSYPQSSILPVIDAAKSSRMLPQPVPSISATPSPLDRPLPPMATSHQLPPDYRATSSLAALLRASEMARVADDEAMEKEEIP